MSLKLKATSYELKIQECIFASVSLNITYGKGKKGQFEREDIPAKRLPVISDFYKAFELQKNLVCETAVPIDSKR